MAVSGESVQVELRVGMLDLALAKLMTEDHHTIEFPTILLPENVEAGSIVNLQCSRALQTELVDREKFEAVQEEILETFATTLPKAPVLRARNITQTSVVLEWDPIETAAADLHFMALYKGDQRLGLIPQPWKRTVTKVSNLEIDAPYDFHLVLSTSAGDFESETLKLKTHKMTDLTGVVVCVGSLAHSAIGLDEIKATLQRLGCKPPHESVKLDTTHFICTTEGGAAFERAAELNIPIVTPEWLKACENERRLVSVRGYYLSANPTPYRPQTDRTESPESQSQGEQAQSEQAQSEQAQSEQAQSEQAQSEQAQGEEPPTEEQPQNENPQIEEEPHDELAQSGEQAQNEQNGAANDAVETGRDETGALDDQKSIEGPGVPSDYPSDNEALKSSENILSSGSHDELATAVNKVGGPDFNVQLSPLERDSGDDELERALEEHTIPEQAGDNEVTDHSTERELEKELQDDPTAALREGEEQRVIVEQTKSVEPQSADVEDAPSQTNIKADAPKNEDGENTNIEAPQDNADTKANEADDKPLSETDAHSVNEDAPETITSDAVEPSKEAEPTPSTTTGPSTSADGEPKSKSKNKKSKKNKKK